MKKYVLSAVVMSLIAAPSAYAMDEGATPAVEVEVPAVDIDTGVVLETPPELNPTDLVVDLPVEGDSGDIDGKGGCVDLTIDANGPVDENGDPVIYYCMGGIALDADAPVDGQDSGETRHDVDQSDFDLASQSGVSLTSAEGDTEVPIRSHDNIQPNFRGGITDRGAEALAASTGSNDAPNPQLLNDEQRGAVRGLRSDEEPAKPRVGFRKLFSKFSKPKSEVIQASATTTTKSLSSKLAEIDRMRDTALRTGDQKLLAKADKLEQRLRADAGKAPRTK